MNIRLWSKSLLETVEKQSVFAKLIDNESWTKVPWYKRIFGVRMKPNGKPDYPDRINIDRKDQT